MPNITINGLPELYRRLDAVRATNLLVPPMQRAVNRVWRRQMYSQHNPPKPANSTYDRTFTLKGSWTVRPVQRASNGVTGVVGSNIKYAPLVKSRQYQSAIHRGRWPTVEQDIDAERPAIEADFQRVVDRALEGR